jgi:hypothetical protein
MMMPSISREERRKNTKKENNYVAERLRQHF